MDYVKILKYGGLAASAIGFVAQGLGNILEEKAVKSTIIEEAAKKVAEMAASAAKETL